MFNMHLHKTYVTHENRLTIQAAVMSRGVMNGTLMSAKVLHAWKLKRY